MNIPCYDKATGTDCPRRKKGCAVDCPEWDAYMKARDEFYERRLAESEADSLAFRQQSARQAKQAKRYMRDKRWHRNKMG